MAKRGLCILSVVFVVLAGSAPSARADFVTFTFEGDFSGLADVNNLNAATTFSGSYTFDSTIANIGDSTFAEYPAVTGFGLTVGGFVFSSSALGTGTIFVDVPPAQHSYDVLVEDAVDGLGNSISSADLSLIDTDGTASLATGSFPPLSLPDLSEFEERSLVAAITPDGEIDAQSLHGTITSITTPLPVPAPGAALLAAIGLTTVASVRRRLA